jgi:hypothetical protein
MSLACIVLTLNEARHIQECLRSVRFADSLIVFDSFSTDNTVALAKQCGAEVIQRRFADYADQRNAALDAAAGRGAAWVLFVDADERVTPALAAEIQRVTRSTNAAGCQIPRHNFLFGKLTLGAGWYPDYQIRLLRVGSARYDPDRRVHEVVMLNGALETLHEPLVHYNYEHLRQFRDKQRTYTAYEADILFRAGVKPKPRNYLLQPLREFKRRYLSLRGWRDGFHGLRLSVLMAWYELRKYQILRALWRQGGDEASAPPP